VVSTQFLGREFSAGQCWRAFAARNGGQAGSPLFFLLRVGFYSVTALREMGGKGTVCTKFFDC